MRHVILMHPVINNMLGLKHKGKWIELKYKNVVLAMQKNIQILYNTCKCENYTKLKKTFQ